MHSSNFLTKTYIGVHSLPTHFVVPLDIAGIFQLQIGISHQPTRLIFPVKYADVTYRVTVTWKLLGTRGLRVLCILI